MADKPGVALPSRAGRLRVTVTAPTNAGSWVNALSQVQSGPARNAHVEIPDAAGGTPGGPAIVPGQPAGAPGNFVWQAPPGTVKAAFVVQRVADGAFRVDLVVVDGCHASGPFRTFVGGGKGVH